MCWTFSICIKKSANSGCCIYKTIGCVWHLLRLYKKLKLPYPDQLFENYEFVFNTKDLKQIDVKDGDQCLCHVGNIFGNDDLSLKLASHNTFGSYVFKKVNDDIIEYWFDDCFGEIGEKQILKIQDLHSDRLFHKLILGFVAKRNLILIIESF